MKKAILTLIAWYRRMGNLWYPLVPIQPQCKFYPTCSEYAQQAIERNGVVRGGFQAAVRVCRCNPLSQGGIHLVT